MNVTNDGKKRNWKVARKYILWYTIKRMPDFDGRWSSERQDRWYASWFKLLDDLIKLMEEGDCEESSTRSKSLDNSMDQQ